MNYTRTLLMSAVLGLVVACDRQPRNPEAATSVTGVSSKPAAIANAKVLTGRVICPLEIVNGTSIREGRSFSVGRKATLVGWSRVADREQPIPPLIHVVFRSTVADGSQDLFWPGVRVPRPELAQNDPRFAMAGYSASGVLPANPGKYKVLVWVGDARKQRECDTGEVFDLQG